MLFNILLLWYNVLPSNNIVGYCAVENSTRLNSPAEIKQILSGQEKNIDIYALLFPNCDMIHIDALDINYRI